MRSLEMQELARSEVQRLIKRDFVTPGDARKSISILRTAANKGKINLVAAGSSDSHLRELENSFEE